MGKRKSNYKNFMILICHRFENIGRRRKRGNLQRKKERKKKNLKSRVTHNHKPTKFHEKKAKTKKLKSRATHNHKLTKFHEQLKQIKRKQNIEIKESKKHVLITSK